MISRSFSISFRNASALSAARTMSSELCPLPNSARSSVAGGAFGSGVLAAVVVAVGEDLEGGAMRAAHEASGADMVTVAVRRVDISR